MLQPRLGNLLPINASHACTGYEPGPVPQGLLAICAEVEPVNEQIRTAPLAPQVTPERKGPVVPGQRHVGRWITAAALLLALGGAGAMWQSRRGTQSVRYETVPATRGIVERTSTATGTVNPELTIIVGSYVSGVVQTLYCDYNTQVKAGQVCAKIDPRPFQTLVSQAKANLSVARAQLEKDKANVVYTKLSETRNRQLALTHSVSQDAADQAKNALDQAEAQVELDQAAIEQRQAELNSAQVNLDYTDIVSPVDGTVVSRNVTQGQTVASSFQTPTLFLIATDLEKMQVDTNVSESDIGGIKIGDKAMFTVDAYPKRIFEGKVTQVRQSPQTVQNVVTFDAVVSIDNHDLALMPGMTASTQIIVDRKDDVLRVPNQALRYVPGGLTGHATLEAPVTGTATKGNVEGSARVWVLREDQPIALDVILGLEDNSYTEIVKGDIREADQVIMTEETGPLGSRAVPASRQ